MSFKRYVCKITSSAGSFLRDFYEERPHEGIMVGLQDRTRRSVLCRLCCWSHEEGEFAFLHCFLPPASSAYAFFHAHCKLLPCGGPHCVFVKSKTITAMKCKILLQAWRQSLTCHFQGKGITYIVIQTALTLFPLTSYPRQIIKSF